MSFLQKPKPTLTVRGLFLGLIATGLILRTTFYLSNPSVWGDEGWVIFEIVYRRFTEILFPTKYFNLAPPLFTSTEKLIYTIIGPSEYALRLFPLLSSLLGVFLFYRLLAKYFNRSDLMACALFLFTFCGSLIYYAAEIKPYSTDVLLTLLIYMLVFSVGPSQLSRSSTFRLGLFGAAALWLSYTSLFVLSGVGAALVLSGLRKKEFKKLPSLFVVSIFWSINFCILYTVIISHLKREPEVRTWDNHFITNIFSLGGLQSAGLRFIELFKDPAGFSFPFLAFIVFLIGCISIFKNNQDKFNLLFFPIPITFFAFLAGKYPFTGRTIVFLLPMVFIFIAEGLAYLLGHSKTKTTGIIVGLLLFIPFLFSATNYFIKPPKNGDLRPAMQYLKDHIQENDTLCLNGAAEWSFWYYLISLQFAETNWNFWILSDNYRVKNSLPYARTRQAHWDFNYQNRFNEKIDSTIKDIDQNNLSVFPKNNRTWVLISNAKEDFENFMVNYLEKIGTRVSEFKGDGSSLYLYDLTTSR